MIYWAKRNRDHLPPWRFDCGTEDYMLEESQQLHRELEAEGIAHTYQEFPGGHTWEYWEKHIEDTLRSAFELDYPRYEIIFCAAATNDSALPLVRRLIADHPHVPARLLIGNDAISENPKLNNVCKGWSAAAHDRIVMADSNVLMPRDYIERLLAAWRPDTGVVSSPPVGCRPHGFWAELECAFLNTYQARWQYVADSIGLGFAQGKSMLYRKHLIEQAGGLRALAAEPAEDAATTKVVRGAGLRVRLVDAPFEQPLGHRGAREVWARQLRWARLRQALPRSPVHSSPRDALPPPWRSPVSNGVATSSTP